MKPATERSPAAAPTFIPNSESLYFKPELMYHALHRFVDYLSEANRISLDDAIKLAEGLDLLFPLARPNIDLFVKAMNK